MNVVIIHYNTPELTEAAIRSLNKNTECNVFLFDNSDTRPFVAEFANVHVINNTGGQFLDFEKILANYPRKVPNRSNWGSAKHCRSVDFMFDVVKDAFVLMDSDVLVKKDITSLIDRSKAWVGSVHTNTMRFGWEIMRVKPYLCYINVPMLLENGVRYFNPNKMWFLDTRQPSMFYDTGAWLYEETKNKDLPYKCVDIDEYIEHFRHGSWKEKDESFWLEEHKNLWI